MREYPRKGRHVCMFSLFIRLAGASFSTGLPNFVLNYSRQSPSLEFHTSRKRKHSGLQVLRRKEPSLPMAPKKRSECSGSPSSPAHPGAIGTCRHEESCHTKKLLAGIEFVCRRSSGFLRRLAPRGLEGMAGLVKALTGF